MLFLTLILLNTLVIIASNPERIVQMKKVYIVRKVRSNTIQGVTRIIAQEQRLVSTYAIG